MAHAFNISNGASLEDCHSNFFALADLNEIKWRKLSSNSVYLDPLKDPVITSFGQCLSAGILVVWRKVWKQRDGIDQFPQDSNNLVSLRELWVFWYGAEPDFSNLIESSLIECEQGSWETCLTYECRCLLFKAFHNLCERFYLSLGYARVGKYFVIPQVLPVTNKNRSQYAFSLRFWMHGDSTVCVGVDGRQIPSVYILDKSHFSAAHSEDKSIKVLLCPFGLDAKLTGVGYKYRDPNMARFLIEWHAFYPHPHKRKLDSQVPNVLEVVVAGVQMKYPASYIFVTLEDHEEAFPSLVDPASKGFVIPTDPSRSRVRNLPTLSLLTPPLSPESSALGDTVNSSDNCATSALPKLLEDKNHISSVKYANIIRCAVCQQGYTSTSDDADDSTALWEFQDSSVMTSCSCPKTTSKTKKQSFLMKDSYASEHLGVPFPKMPFHRRSASSAVCDAFPKNAMKSLCANNALPTLHATFSQLKKHYFSSISGESSNVQATSLDPIMPTLSPQPPVLKDDTCSSPEAAQTPLSNSSLSRDSPHPVVSLKGKITDETLSPLHASLLNTFENANLEIPNKKSPVFKSEPDLAENAEFACVTLAIPPLSEGPQAIEKPCLEKREYDGTVFDQPLCGQLYDYRHLVSPLWQPPPLKRRCYMASQAPIESIKEEVMDNCDNNRNDISFSFVPFSPKDPYEFTDGDEAAPSDKGFRPKDMFGSEDKFLLSNVPSPITPLPSAGDENPSSHGNEDPDKVLSPSASKTPCPKFIREEDLAVSLNDLDNIFDTDSSEGEDNSEVPTASKEAVHDDYHAKFELIRMYPTPPSLEHHAVPSPFATLVGHDVNISECEMMRDEYDEQQASYVFGEAVDVYIPPLLTKFEESTKYEAVPEMFPFHEFMPSTLKYEPSKQQNYNKWRYNNMMRQNSQQMESLCSYSQPPLYDEDQGSQSLYSQESHDLNFPMSNYDSSPASVLNSMDSTIEANPLLLNLLLSDSLLNVFKDHNFEVCCLCVCNMSIKGSDAGTNLPIKLIPTWNDESQYKCTCGFSAVVNRHRSSKSGLFYEDELETTGSIEQAPLIKEESQQLFSMENIPGFVLDLLRIQCKSVASSFSLFHKFMLEGSGENFSLNDIERLDACEVCFMALEEARYYVDAPALCKLDENLKSSCLHMWSYSSYPFPPTNTDARLHLEALKPLLQSAVHKKTSQQQWDVTYVVSGPLTWREFLRLAAKGTEDQCEPQPIPSLLLGHERDYVRLSPFALKYWDKKLLEPYSLQRDIAYIVVAPESKATLESVQTFFTELSSVYEAHNLGKHRPITTVLRNGIMRVGTKAASRVAKEPDSNWFSAIGGESAVAKHLKLYARICKYRLAPHLSTLSFDGSSDIFDSGSSSKSDKIHINSTLLDNCNSAASKYTENDISLESSISSTAEQEDDNQVIPALVIYIVEPFTYGQCSPNINRLAALGVLHMYADMLSSLPPAIKNAIHLQILSLDTIMCSKRESKQFQEELKGLALSVYSQSYQSSPHQTTAKTLTGFGPAAAQDRFLASRNKKIPYPIHLYNQPYVLASVKDKQTQLGEMFGDGREKFGVLYVSYCLTEDKKYLLASCTNDKGEFSDITVINIGIPNRHRRKQVSIRRFALLKLLDFILEVISYSVHPWRLVIDRFGRLGHGELKTWASLLNRKVMQTYSKRLRDTCPQCSTIGIGDGPSILSVNLVSLNPDSALRVMSDQCSPNERFSSNRYKTCTLNTPEDATATHILVFPTSTTIQSSQAAFQQEGIDPLPVDLFDGFQEDDMGGTDIDDIMCFADNPQSCGNSPQRDSSSQPSSPSSSFKISPGGFGGPNRCESMLAEIPDESLQLSQQPLALGYYVSTAKTGHLPKWFWSACPHRENSLPVFLKSALHLQYAQHSSDDLLHNATPTNSHHPLDSGTTNVLRYVLEGYNSLSWLVLDPEFRDRRSCLPVHMQILMQLYGIVEAML